MKYLIGRIREMSGLSQTEFASEIGVTFATVNRWENGHASPNTMAQNAVYDFCVRNRIQVVDDISDNIRSECRFIPKGHRALMFHGSREGISGPIGPSSRSSCDFGRGFYMGTDPSQPMQHVCGFDDPVLYVMSVDFTGLKVVDVPAEEWPMVLAFNRGYMEGYRGSRAFSKYSRYAQDADVLIGKFPDDRMFQVLDDFGKGTVTDQAVQHSMNALKLGNQCVCLTQRACDSVRIEREFRISRLERLLIRDAAVRRRESGSLLTREISRRYRRDGRYFDEIIGGAE